MKTLLRKILPKRIVSRLVRMQQMRKWVDRDYLEYAPQVVKQKVFLKYCVMGAPWVETGTFRGTTTNFLRRNAPHVHSIEPGPELYADAVRRFAGMNVTLHNGVSEDIMPTLLPTLSGDINFWLDGHYSAGVTFKGDTECPVEDELKAIEANADNFANVSILIDDVRCFLPRQNGYSDYPSIDYLVDWARKHGYRWQIVHDIFIMQKNT